MNGLNIEVFVNQCIILVDKYQNLLFDPVFVEVLTVIKCFIYSLSEN